MPSLNEVKKFRQSLFDESMALIDKKGADYNRRQQLNGDTLFNLKVAEILGIVPTAERGILVRLSDKFMRLISLMEQGENPAVKGESVRDTVRDIHNYIDYALQLFEERRAEQTPPEPIGPGEVLRFGATYRKTRATEPPYPDDRGPRDEGQVGPRRVV